MWFVLALGSALFFALQSALGKRAGEHVHPNLVAWAAFAFALPVYLVVLWLDGLPAVGPTFWPWLLTSMGINLVAIPLYFKALREGELSIVLPLVGLSPAFALVTEWVLLGDAASGLQVVGVLVVVAGTYLLHADAMHLGVLEPVRRLLRDRGARMGIVTAALWSVTAVADRGAVLASSASFYLSVFGALFSVVLLAWLIVYRRPDMAAARQRPWALVAVGITGAVMALCQMTALGLALAAVVIAIKRLAGLVGVLLGGMVWQERGMGVRLLAAAIMIAGAVLLGLS